MLFSLLSPTEARVDDRQQPAPTSFKCPTCPAVFCVKSLFLAHLEDCKLKVRCPYCSNTTMRFKDVYHLLEHVVRNHQNEDPSNLVPESAVTEASEGKVYFEVVSLLWSNSSLQKLTENWNNRENCGVV